MEGPNQAVSRAGPVNKSPGAGGGGETNPLADRLEFRRNTTNACQCQRTVPRKRL
jgi:hypothetical protein